MCGSLFDDGGTSDKILATLRRHKIQASISRRELDIEGNKVEYRLIRFNDSGIESTIVSFGDDKNSKRRDGISASSGNIFLRSLLDEFKTRHFDIYLTYGGYWVAHYAAQLARRFCSTNVFYLCNLAYNRDKIFDEIDAIIVPSEFSRKVYYERLGINSIVLPPLIDRAQTILSEDEKTRRFLTFVNPSLEKGSYFFAGIARDLNLLRPDIPILIVEGRSTINVFGSMENANSLTNLNVMQNVMRPKLFYRETRILVVPSLCEESFGRVAVEGSFNGLPVLCSNRGALPEAVGITELTLDIPSRFTPKSKETPTSIETAPWVNLIQRLWDDAELASQFGAMLKEKSKRYLPEVVAKQTVQVFQKLATFKDTRSFL